MSILSEQIDLLEHAAPMELRGTVIRVRGLAIHVADLPVPVGATVRILRKGRVSRASAAKDEATSLTGPSGSRLAEVVGFDRDATIVMPLGSTAGVCRGDGVIAEQFSQFVRVGPTLRGRVLDARGRPIDGRGPIVDTVVRPLVPGPIDPMERPVIDGPLATGIRAIDGLCSAGRGQRLGVFAAPGLGKSVLMGMMARGTSAAVTVIALVGERGREVVDFIENQMGDEGLSRSVVVCATSDEPALLRIRAALLATTVAEYFRDSGLDVLLIMDSLTRYCHALRQTGLAAGEPPTSKGYPPSVFAAIPSLLERCGRTRRGSITGFYAVLVETDDLDDPVAHASRGVLDGHVVLSRKLAHRGHWPAIDLLESVSRVADNVTDGVQQSARDETLRLLNAYAEVEDLLNVGAYAPGSNPAFDLAIACKPMIDQLVRQGRSETAGKGDFARTRKQVLALAQQIQQTRTRLQRLQRAPQGISPPVAAAGQ